MLLLKALPTSGKWAALPTWILAHSRSYVQREDYGSFIREEFFTANAGSVTELCPLDSHQISLLSRFAQQSTADYFPEAWGLHSVHTGKAEYSMTSSELLTCHPEGQAPTADSTVELCSVGLKANSTWKAEKCSLGFKGLEFVLYCWRTNYNKLRNSKHQTFIISWFWWVGNLGTA